MVMTNDKELSPREKQTAELAAQGFRNREIAEVLQIKEGTVEQYLCRVYEKVGVESRTKLVKVLHT